MLSKKSAKNRNPIFDLLRIILTLFVINVHIRIITGISPNSLDPFTWYTVPIFIVLSFFYRSNKPLSERLKRLILPLVAWSIIGFIIHTKLISVQNIFLQLITGHVVNTPLYYLVLLAWFTIINWLLDFLPNRFKIVVFSIIICISFYLEYSLKNYLFFSPMITVIEKSYGRFVELIKYVPIGLAFAFLRKKIIKNNYFFYLAILFSIIFLLIFKIPQPPDFHYSGLKIFVGSIAIFSFVLSMSNFKFNNLLDDFICFLGKYSFGVYLSHYLLLELLLKIFPLLKIFIQYNSYLFLIVYMIFCYLFCFLLDLITYKKLSFLLK
jgi:peptidoglycan/LPS O-acetylase OafA/YrhL